MKLKGILFGAALLGAFAADAEWLYPLRVVAGPGQALSNLPPAPPVGRRTVDTV